MFVLYITLVVMLFAFLSLAFLLMTAQQKPKNLDVEINGSKVSFIQDESGTHIVLNNIPQDKSGNVIRDGDGFRARDYDVIPDMIDSTPRTSGNPDFDFWHKLATLDTLPCNERVDIVRKLGIFGFIPNDEVMKMSLPDAGIMSEPETPSAGTEEPKKKKSDPLTEIREDADAGKDGKERPEEGEKTKEKPENGTDAGKDPEEGKNHKEEESGGSDAGKRKDDGGDGGREEDNEGEDPFTVSSRKSGQAEKKSPEWGEHGLEVSSPGAFPDERDSGEDDSGMNEIDSMLGHEFD